MSHLMLEIGSADAAFGWAQKALRSTKTESPANMVNALCAGVMAYSSKWLVKKAEMLAVEAVQQAKYHFGTRHPLYIKALLHFCHFSTEFKQDNATLDIAKHTLETAKLTYGCEVLQVALAHRAVCKALLVLQNFDDQRYHYHATESLKMARKLLPPQHPMMYLFLHTSASALQWKAIHSSKEMQEAALRLAESEAREALEAVATVYGEISLRTAQMCSLLGQIYSKIDKLQLAEEHLQKSVLFMRLCLPQNSNFSLLAMATLGTFYKIIGKPKEAIELLKKVVQNSDCGIYLKWVHVCFENLIATLQSMNNNKEADEYQIQLAQWLRDNKVYDRVVSLEELSAKARPFSEFMDEFDKWDRAKEKVKDLAMKQLLGKK
ncbi:hypothetical protein FSP39_010840 [Pinctada imbricata]|uniref:Uncharacterized protein n=1 Tax=Pinctada imbricata TaxID=66713 RepID=A0AA89BQJ0_PINIB|nr:hypothetical protein FSP39_010840 [Pinctada imbricata]